VSEPAEPIDAAAITYEQGMYYDTWLVKYRGNPMGAVGYAFGDGRWRAAWRGNLVGDSYPTQEAAARALIERRLRALAEGKD
jgi:hypothetical protein